MQDASVLIKVTDNMCHNGDGKLLDNSWTKDPRVWGFDIEMLVIGTST